MLFVWIAVGMLPALVTAASEEQTCYTSGSVAGIVIATVVVTIVMGGLAAAALLYLWKQRSALSGEGKKKPGSSFFSSSVPDKGYMSALDLKKKPRPDEGGKAAYAFDNPFFKDDEADAKHQDAAEKGESGFPAKMENGRSSPNNKISAAAKLKKSRPFSSLQFANVFHQGFKKPRALDDNFIPKALERVEVPLRGHDFTGLGFNICGNMRDGIFVKDVLHRGPASESGKIKAGDRIVGVWVSFSGMVYEDALTILSYASPYDVKLELEKTVDTKIATCSPGSKLRLVSSSFRTGQRLFHPLYRSQSFDDLTQIGKDNHSSASSNAAGSPAAVTPSCNSCPKRSQSIEASTTPQPRIHQCTVIKGSPKPSPDSPKIVVSNEKAKATSSEIKEPKTENASLQQRAVKSESGQEEVLEPKSSDESDDPPTAPPRKIVHVKRKAPAPPPVKEDSKKETSAIVHREAGDDNSCPHEESDKSEELGDIHSLSSESPSPETVVTVAAEDPASSPKRKASSLGDLTTLDSSRNKKVQAPSSILERAVSLDLQQSLPEGNLVKQKMILKAPTFEDPEEDLRTDDKMPSPKLKDTWSNSEDQIQKIEIKKEQLENSTITNGHTDLNHNAEDEPSYFSFDSPDETQTLMQMTSTPVKDTASYFQDTVSIVSQVADENIPLDVNNDSSSLANPLTFPIIKPNLSHYEKLSNPGKSSDLEFLSFTEQKQDSEESQTSKLESPYKPLLSSNSFKGPTDLSSDGNSSLLSAIDIVNGNGNVSSYRTASEDSSEDVSSTDVKKHSLSEISGIRVHGGVAGFAKTLIISTPIEGESISLNADLDLSLPKLEPPV